MPKTDKQLVKRDAKRDLGAEFLQAVREMKARKGQVITGVASKAEPVPRFSFAGKFESGR